MHTSKVTLKILQARLQPYVNQKLPDVQAGFRKGRGIRNQIANIKKKKKKIQGNIYCCFIDTVQPFTVWITTNWGNFFKRWKSQTILPASWETCLQVKMQQLEPDMEQWTGSKLGKEYVKAVFCHPAYLTYM